MATFHPDQKCVITDNVLGGVSISHYTIQSLYSILHLNWQALLYGWPVEGVHVFSEGIFSLLCQPDVIFKISKDVFDRWKHVKHGVAVCKGRQLDLLVIPTQTLLSVFLQGAPRFVIAEQRLPLSHDFYLQRELYRSLGDKLNPALEQLVIFIIEVGFRDVDFRNIPILDKALESETKPQIALVDLENCVGKHERNPLHVFELAFSGNDRSIRGLLRCITPSNFRTVQSATEKEGIYLEKLFGDDYYLRALNARTLELEVENKHREIIATSETYNKLVRLVVDSLSGFGLLARECEVYSSALSLDKQFALGYAPRFFKTSVTVSNAHSIISGVIVLDSNSSLLALGVVVDGSEFDPDQELLVKCFEERFTVNIDDYSFYAGIGVFSFTFLLSPLLDHLGMFQDLRFPTLREYSPIVDQTDGC